MPAYPEGRHICNLYLDRRAAAEALETSRIKRYTVPLNGRDVTGEILFDEFAELPTIDYERDAGLIGIGGHFAVPPLPHHRAYGSRTRRFD